MNALGTSIRIFLADGTPEGLRLIEKSNWTGLAVVASRSVYSEVRSRDELQRPGVYVLRGSSGDDSAGARLYVGEAESAAKRIDAHAKRLDWWDDFVVFTSKDESLNKAFIRYLEARLIEIAGRAKRVDLDNTQTPQVPRLSEADTADAEGFLANMLLIYPLLGIDAFEEPPPKALHTEERPLLFLRGKIAEAQGQDFPSGFVVYSGALTRRGTTNFLAASIDDQRKRLEAEKVLVEDGDQLRLTQDYTFSSPSTAAAVLLGRSANGRIEWKDATGRTLKEIQEANIPDIDEDDG